MKMKLGELNKKISIIREEVIVNEYGVEEKIDTIVGVVWAKVQNMSGTEVYRATQDYAKMTTRFIIRYRRDLTTNDFISFNDRKYNIVYINNYNYSNDFYEIIGVLV